MSTTDTTGLIRLSIDTPGRRLDLAIPEYVPVAELMPLIMRHATEDAIDETHGHGGYRLCSQAGQPFKPDESLAAQGVLDGEILKLLPHHEKWPEPEYDDLVDAIAAGSRSMSVTWSGKHTRVTGLTIATVFSLGVAAVLPFTAASWLVTGLTALVLATLLMIGGIGLARAWKDSATGSVLGILSMVLGTLGGYVLLGGTYSLGDLGSPHLILAATGLLTASVTGLIGIGDQVRVFISGTVIAFFTAIAASFVMMGFESGSVAVVTLALIVGGTPLIPNLSMRIGRLPLPDVPLTAEDLVKDREHPEKAEVFRAVERTDEVLTGLLMGISMASATAIVWIAYSFPGTPELILIACVTGVLLLRARQFQTLRQRLPFLTAGLVGTATLATTLFTMIGTHNWWLATVAGVVPLALIILISGLRYSERAPGPRLGRFGDIFDFLMIGTILPMVTWSIGLFGVFRGFAG